jgi:hypothetical protein
MAGINPAMTKGQAIRRHDLDANPEHCRQNSSFTFIDECMYLSRETRSRAEDFQGGILNDA